MSILTNRAMSVNQAKNDEIYVIYGDEGTGKTVLASTFPKTKEKPMLYLDILEGGTGSIPSSQRENIQVVPIDDFTQIDEVLTDVLAGKTTDDTGAEIKIGFSTIVIDSATQLEFLMKKHLMQNKNVDRMNLGLWGDASNQHDAIWNACKTIYKKTGTIVVVICHQKEEKNEDNPQFAKLIPSMMTKAAHALCAKASYVWYTKVEKEQVVDPKTQEVIEKQNFMTIIDTDSYLLTKTRKPPEMKVPKSVRNLTYPIFKKNIIDNLK